MHEWCSLFTYYKVDAKEGIYEELPPQPKKLIPFIIEVLIIEFKALSKDLKYVFLGIKETFLVVMLMHLDENLEEYLISVLRKYKGVLDKNIMDINGMDPLLCAYNITFEAGVKPIR